MKGLIKRLEDIFSAVAFAEEGEFETARRIIGVEKPLFKKIKDLQHKVDLTVDDLISIAVTYAETGEHEKAVEILMEVEDRLVEVKRTHQKDIKILTPEVSSS